MTDALQDPSSLLLQKHFGLTEFRRGQKEILRSVLNGRDALAVLPTGGGKSLCYQYPAMVRGELVVVISPLIALMRDQVASMQRLSIPAGCLHSQQTIAEKREVFRAIERGGPYLLYVSPERTQKDGFQTWIQKVKIALFAIDEAHCVSQWGHDFREEYSQLDRLKSLCPDVPVLALTASATPTVLRDIARQLKLKSPARHVHGFYRPNLYYQVETCENEDEKLQIVVQALRQFQSGRVIIYCGTRKSTESIASTLRQEFANVESYHAGMSAEARSQVQEDFAQGATRVLVATNAFGMGIDQADVRLVVHFHMPANIDSLYQEMGRAGRDSQPSTCLLLYSRKDRGLQSFFIQSSKANRSVLDARWRALDTLVAYSEGGECRHAEILTYYQDSQRIDKCGHCDVCEPTSLRRVFKPLHPTELKKSPQVRIASRTLRKRSSDKSASLSGVKDLNSADRLVFESLRQWRKEKAKELDVPAFVILTDRSLCHLAEKRPSNKSELAEIYGFGEAKVERFGTELLRIL